MPYNRRGSYGRRRRMAPVVNSMKNSLTITGSLAATPDVKNIAKAVNSPSSASAPEEVVHGSVIKAIWITLDACGLGGTGVANNLSAFLMKNPGASLTPPDPTSVGTSNEKKFVIKEWHAMIMDIRDGPNPVHWEGWIKIPKRYHRMGTDDTWIISLRSGAAVTGLYSLKVIYKWYS